MRKQLQTYIPNIKDTLSEADNIYMQKYETDITTFLKNNELINFKEEFFLLALYYRTSLEENLSFKNANGKTIESHWYEYNRKSEELYNLISKLNITAEPHEAEEAFFIDSIVIRYTKKQDAKSLTIKNYTLCSNIAMALAKLMEVPMYYNKDDCLKKTFFNPPPSKKPESYIKNFISGTYPLFIYLKNECLPNKTNSQYYNLINKFLEAIDFELNEIMRQQPEAYIKSCFRKFRK